MSKSPRRRSTALARRRPAPPRAQTPKPATGALEKPANKMALVLRGPQDRLPVIQGDTAIALADLRAQQTLGEHAFIGDLGLMDLRLAPEEDAVLSEPVDEHEVRIKPTGQVYVSHTSYTRRLNRAFGRLGWALAPAGTPKRVENSVVVPYVLYIHGIRVAFAYGEQEYHESNRDQTYGDAIESTVASALRRCCKRLGVFLELWEPEFGEAWKAKHAIGVWVDGRDGKRKQLWRRKADPPLWQERKSELRRPPQGAPEADVSRPAGNRPAPVQPAPPPREGRDGDEVITEAQLKRLHAIASNAHRKPEVIKSWLAVAYDVTSSKQIKRRDYQAICAALEAPGPLGMPPQALTPEVLPAEDDDREPGEDG